MNPGSISLNPFGGKDWGGGSIMGPYSTGASTGNPRKPAGYQQTIAKPEAVRATGSGPFDAAYRQNLATYAGGLSERPSGGVLSFNPTGNMFGNPSGAGTAPVLGSPTDLLSQALGGQGYKANTTAPTPKPQSGGQDYWKFWMTDYMNRGKNLQGAY